MTLTVKQDKILNNLLPVFLGISFITSQLSVALSSIGIAGSIILFIIKSMFGREKIYTDRTLLYLLFAFFLWQAATSLYSDNPAQAFAEILKKASVFFIIIYSAAVLINKNQVKLLLLILFIFTALVSVYESIRYLIDFSAQEQYSLGEFRLSYFGYPITLGEIKMIVLLLLFPFILNKESFILNKWLLIIITLPVILSLYFTNSRNAILGLFSGLIVIGAVKHRYFLMALMFFTALFLYAAPSELTERIESIVQINHPSNAARFTMWKTGLKMVKDNPLTGFGDVDFLKEYKKYKQPETYAEGVHLHNNIMQVTVLYGFPGLIIWFVLMLYIFIKQIKAFRLYREDKFLGIILLSSVSAMIAMQVSGLTEWNFCDAEFAVLFWFVFSFPFISKRLAAEK